MIRSRGASPGQDLERPDFPSGHLVAAGDLPELAALFRGQRLEVDRPEHFEERLFGVIESREAGGGRCEQDDLRHRLEDAAKLPAKVCIDVLAKGLKVLDHQDQLSVQPVRGVQHRCLDVILQVLFAPALAQGRVPVAQFVGELRVVRRAFPGEVEQGVQPEVRQAEDFLALLHEADGQEVLGEFRACADLRRHPCQQHGLSATAWSDDESVLA